MENIKTVHVDARRLLCPMPILRAQDAIDTLDEGDFLILTCSDPGTEHDLPSWSRIHGHEVENIDKQNNELVFTIRIGKKDR